MATPAWIGATPGSPPLAAQIDQFLGTHAATLVYTGALFASQTTAGSGAVDSNSLYVAQSFTTGASTTTLGRFAFNMATTGAPAPMTVQLQTNNAGAPSGAVLVSTVIPPNWCSATSAYYSVPLPVAGLTPSTEYWLVAAAAGDVSGYFAFNKSNQTSGASTSTNGSTWTAQSYGLLYEVYDQTALLPLVHTWEDSGARITALTSNANAAPATLEEYTAAQGTNQYVYSNRTFGYSGTSLVSVT